MDQEPTTGGRIPDIHLTGPIADCGEQLGEIWRDVLRQGAESVAATSRPWWQTPAAGGLLERYAPHLPDLYRGMARGAGLRDDQVGTRASTEADGCTSFAITPAITRDGIPICGQTKDTPTDRLARFRVLRLACTDAPQALTLTYPGWLFGHGFVSGGCAIFRNSLYGPSPKSGLRYGVFGLLALHCRTVEEVATLAETHGFDETAHVAVADSEGGVIGIENTGDGLRILKPEGGLYTHANAICMPDIATNESTNTYFEREESLHRQSRLRTRLKVDNGRLTAALALAALTDHDGYPVSICRHQNDSACTTAAVVAEPTRGLLHCTLGHPCSNLPHTYSL